MRVLIDVHHSDLMESLHRLFEDRLGFEVHVPYGLEWKEEGIWNFGHGYPDGGMGVARQFLLTTEVDDLQPHRKRRLTTLAEARNLGDWAFVVATVPDNEPGYARFAHEQGARYVVQVGNVNQFVDMRYHPLILDATGQYGQGIPFTPEFDLNAFGFEPSTHPRRVTSFVNLFPHLPCYPEMLATFSWLTGWEKGIYGHVHEGFTEADGFIKPTSAIAPLMRAGSFVWHDKITGDGFGYVIHYAAAVGRPLIGHGSHYRGQLASDLWEDGVTCIDLDKHPPVEAAELMERIVMDPGLHQSMCMTIAARVRARIDFAADALRVAQALGIEDVRLAGAVK